MGQALHLIAGDHVVAWLDAGDALTDALHHPGCLVAQNAGEQPLRICKIPCSSSGSILMPGIHWVQQEPLIPELAKSSPWPSRVYESVWHRAVASICSGGKCGHTGDQVWECWHSDSVLVIACC